MAGIDDAKMYHHLGSRDAIAGLCAKIRSQGLVAGVRSAVEELRSVAPENPHIEPVVKILKEHDNAKG